MREALIVNPFSREELADALHKALSMPLRERVRRWEALMEGVRSNDITAWRDGFVARLKEAGALRRPSAPSREALEKLRAQELAGARKLGDAPPVAVTDRGLRRDPGSSDAYDILLP
jgi:hypothetical protein